MSMERRALLAFVASMLLFLAYDALYLGPRGRKQAERRRILQEQQAAIADSLAALEPTVVEETPASDVPATAEETVAETRHEPLEQPLAAAPARFITVASGLFEITLTTNGAEVVSTRLLEYKTRGLPVELYPQDPDWTDERVLSVSLDDAQSSFELGRLGFDVLAGGAGAPLGDGARVTVDPRREHTDLLFRARTPDGRTVERNYRFFPDRYDYEASVTFSAAEFPGVERMTWGFGPGMTATEKNVKDDQQSFKASVLRGEEFDRRKPGNFAHKTEETFPEATFSWAAVQTKYFLTAIVPPEPTRAVVTMSGDKPGHRITQKVSLPTAVGRGEVTQTVRVYMGPLSTAALKPINAGLDRNIEMGYNWIRPVSKIVLKSMIWMHGFIPNYGWVIIIISVLTKVLFYRLTHKSFKSMKEMQDLQPKLAALKEKYGDDRQRLSQETMKAYKEAGVNPLGGCLPMLLQMPVFVALFSVLKFTIEVRGAHFIGWINDLSQQDVLFQLPVTLPLLGNAFSLLPILMGASMFAQSKLGGSPTGGPSTTTPPGFQTMLPIVFTVLFYRMPSGLVLYWIVNTVLSVAQQYYIHRDSNTSKESDNATNAPHKRRAKSKER